MDRLELHEVLCRALGSRHVYFQPPESIKMVYPAIVYSIDDIKNNHADNVVYRQRLTYQITVIDENPDSEIVATVSKFPNCRFNRHFVSGNLNHDVFTITT